MSKKLVISGLVLLVTGTAVLGWVIAAKRKEQQRVAHYKAKYGSEADEYLKLYNDWLQSPPEQRAHLPWGLDQHGKTKTKAQLQQEQQERLQADLNELAAGKKDAYPFADILYGENWQEELRKYKKRKEFRESVFTGSIVCTVAGGGILTWYLLTWIGRFLLKVSFRLREFVDDLSLNLRERTDKKLVRANEKAKAKIKSKAKAKRKVKAEAKAGSKSKTEPKKLTRAEEKAKARAEAKEKIRAEAEARAKAKAERKAQAEAEKLAKAQEKAKAKAEAKERIRAEAEARAKANAERKAQAEAEKLAKAQEKARAKAEAKEKVRAEAEARARANAEKKAQAEAEKLAKAERKAKAETEEKVGIENNEIEEGPTLGQREKRQEPPDQVEKHPEVLTNSDWQSFEVDSAGQGEQAQPQTLSSMRSGTGIKNSADKAEEISVLLSDEESIELVESLEATAENMSVSPKLEDSLKAQTENLEKQMAEFKQMAQGVQQTAFEHSKPINSTLNELNEQVSAIREYATSQQDRLKKLQDGYDWNIMRTFCLRVIRCIDNVESRIGRLAGQDMEVADLEEVRDELLFALESSGVEQFEPEMNSDYHGQEKFAEAVKEKEHCEDPNQTGKITKVIRPGYQYFIDEENIKVVRPAQVKLFG